MPQPPTVTTPFSVHPGPRAGSLLGRLAALAAPVMDPLLGLTALDRLYADLPHGNFIDAALERLGISVQMSDEHLRRVPATGAVIVVANHPTGALDGLTLAQALMRRRSDVRLLGNHLLSRVPEMREWTIAVNPFDPRSIENRRGLRAARDWLGGGGLLVVFPAGEVSNVARAGGTLVDPDWKHGVLSLARWSSATVVPAFVDARSSRWFRWAGVIHPRLRTVLLPRELLRLRNRRVTICMGAGVGAERLARFADESAQIAYLRARAYALEPAPSRAPADRQIPVAPAISAAALARDVAALPAHRELCRHGDLSVYCATAAELPAVLREIGRLREITFRAVGEGTGRALDLDRFDDTYQHLFVWNHARSEVAGAYRIGATDRVCGSAGARGLYSHTLFRYSPAFVKAIGPALELGRSFVRAEYQRESSALLLLWKGIGALVAREPRYRRLFGPVSISARYSPPSRALMARFLATAGADSAWHGHVHPKRRPPDDPALASLVSTGALTMGDVDVLVREFEHGHGVPVLVRQYWKLNARVLGCTIDAAFGQSLDVLMLVDLADVTDGVLERYLGREGAAAFRAHHLDTSKRRSGINHIAATAA